MIHYSKFKNQFIMGYSVRGSSHERLHLPNQDFFLIGKFRGYEGLVVADGVGSNKYSHVGSKIVCKSVFKTFAEYARNKITDGQITKTIFQKYKRYLRKYEKGKAGTTCLFAVVRKHKLFVGQAGDGVCCVNIDGVFKMSSPKKTDFTNEVVALSAKRRYANWRFSVIDITNANDVQIMLLTDGISEDIVPEKMQSFMNYVVKQIQSDKSNGLKRMLDEWGVPGSIDDKTIAVARWRK